MTIGEQGADIGTKDTGLGNSAEVSFRLGEPVTSIQKDIKEAYMWNKLFNEGYMTAHELSTLGVDDKPEILGEVYKTETRNLVEIKQILDQNLTDDDFRTQLYRIRQLLPRPFAEMVGMEQTQPHYGIDPVDHTMNALAQLDTHNLAPEDALIARTTLVFHDIGKVDDSWDREHPRHSAEISASYLQKMAYSRSQIENILKQIRWHDALGDVSREDGRNIFDPDDVLLFFDNEKDLELHRRIALADISSIPGLARFIPNVQKAYDGLVLELRSSNTRVLADIAAPLPFAELDNEKLDQIANRTVVYEKFDNIDIEENMAQRRSRFMNLPEEDREYIEQMIVQQAMKNGKDLLFVLKMTGNETSRGYVEDLEKKYGRPLYNLRIASGLFDMTYNMWESRNIIISEKAPVDIDLVRGKVHKVVERARELAQYKVLATHVTGEDAEWNIERSKALVKSEVSSEKSDYEGEGVYTGILGNYRQWSDGRVFEMIIQLADTLPIVAGFNDPKAMANVLCEMVDIEKGLQDQAIPHGAVQWYNNEYDKYNIPEWKADILKEYLGSNPDIVTDELGLPSVIMDTREDPIVWSSICRTLLIRRFIPMSEIGFIGLNKGDDNAQSVDDDIVKPIRVKGIKSRERMDQFLKPQEPFHR